MANPDKEPPDEIQYRRPDIIQWWINDMGGKPMDGDMIHRYLSESPFFDWTTKNGLLIDQSRTNMDTFLMVNNRKQFEENLKNRSGTEYLIVEEPQPAANKELAAQGTTTGIWVIRKQDRQPAPRPPRIRPPYVLVEKGKDGQDAWELTVLGTYFVVGENVYQAPNVFDIVGNRLLSAATRLHDFFDIADGLPRFTPAMGHHYLSPRVNKPTTSSFSGTPSGSREGSVVPGEETQSLKSGSANAESSQATNALDDSNARDAKLLQESLIKVVKHGDEFTDENPLLGEPGNLRFNTSMAAVKKRRADEEAAAVAKARAEQESASTSRIATPKPEKGPTPPSVFTTDTKQNVKGDKSSKDERRQGKGDKKRRKSRHGGTATSPTTPSSATTPQAPNPLA